MIHNSAGKSKASSMLMAGKAAFVDIGLPGFEMPKYPNRIIITGLFNWVFCSCHHFFHEGGKDCFYTSIQISFLFLWPFDLIPSHGLPLGGFAMTLGHHTR
jgi:hypothetical protein